MSEIEWVLEHTVLAIHNRQISEHGGTSCMCDGGLLSSAIARPQILVAYGEVVGLWEPAASYTFGIAKNHPFVDGNKRTAFVVMRTFLLLNGKDLNTAQEDKYLTFLKLAAGEIGEEELAEWIKAELV